MGKTHILNDKIRNNMTIVDKHDRLIGYTNGIIVGRTC